MKNSFDLIDLDITEDYSKRRRKKGSRHDFGSLYDEPYKASFGEGLLLSLGRFAYFAILFMYLETVFHIWAFSKINLEFIVKLVMCLPNAAFLALFTSFFKKKVNKIINWIAMGITLLIYVVNVLYHAIFKVFFSFLFIDKTNTKVVQYYREIWDGIKANWFILLLVVVVPVGITILLNKLHVLKYDSVDFKFCFIVPSFIVIGVLLEILVIPLFGKDLYSPYDLCKNENISEFSFEKIGALATLEIELRNSWFPRKFVDTEEYTPWVYVTPDPIVIDTPVVDSLSGNDGEVISQIVEKVIDTSPNILDIDFVSLGANESDETVAAIHNYFASVEPTYKNEYTGMFKGFNLIFLTAEGFSRMAVDEQHTPTLYKLVHEGFVFNNFYNPRTGGSTSDGEFVCSTSLMATNGGAKNFKIVGQNSMPFALGNMFNSVYGITSRAYHDNDYAYYGRDITYPGMGYYYQGVGNGVEIPKRWPESDLDMMKATIPEYIDDELFHIYYMTVSGHLNYNFTGNWCAKIHKDEVADLPYSEPCQAYIACNMELDLALQYLIEQLEEKGIADRTVICFTGDHWPYGLTNEEISEILGHTVEENFELYKSNLILWSGAIKEPIEIDKYCCSLDIVPTLMNLFGFDYDSRLFMGRDILSDTEGMAIMFNRSFITNKCSYNSQTKEVINFTDEELPENYVSDRSKIISSRWKYSQKIMDTDYYKYICDALGIEIPYVEENYFVDYSKFNPGN